MGTSTRSAGTAFLCFTAVCLLTSIASAQRRGGGFNYASKTSGERFDDLSPAAIAGISLGVVAGCGAMIVTLFFCYYVYRQHRQYQETMMKNQTFDARRI